MSTWCDACQGKERPLVLCAPCALRTMALRDKRKRVLAERGESPSSDIPLTCDDCPAALECQFAFDLYNQNGDCLADK